MPQRLRYSHRQVSAVPHKNGSLEAALAQLRRGGMVVVCDDPDRENEGDLCMAAQFVTAEKIAFMACEARGLICLSLPSQRCDELELPLMVPANDGCEATGFTVSIEARTGVTTGISAADRAAPTKARSTPTAGPRTSCVPAISSRCGRARTACSSGADRPRPRSISPAWPGSPPAGCCARS